MRWPQRRLTLAAIVWHLAAMDERITFRTKPELRGGLQAWADAEKRSLANLINVILADALEHRRLEQHQIKRRRA